MFVQSKDYHQQPELIDQKELKATELLRLIYNHSQDYNYDSKKRNIEDMQASYKNWVKLIIVIKNYLIKYGLLIDKEIE